MSRSQNQKVSQTTQQGRKQWVGSPQNPEFIEFEGQSVELEPLLQDYRALQEIINDPVRNRIIEKYYEEVELKPYQAELIRMQEQLKAQQRGMIVLVDGRDAAGKGGTIKRIVRYMNERHCRIIALGKSTEEQRRQWYFQKYADHFPGPGDVVLFDRSWYNRALVERVFGFCTEVEYQDFMNTVLEFEQGLFEQGMVLVKLYFSVSKEVQQYRFDRRKTDEKRQWKLSEVDLLAQERWDDFIEQEYQMFKLTSTPEIPWTIIRSDIKHKARLNSMKVILDAVPGEWRNKALDLVPDPEIVIPAAREVELIEAAREIGTFIPKN